jgi:glyoxylate reductase
LLTADRYDKFTPIMRPTVFVTKKLPAPALERLGQVCDYAIGAEQGPLNRETLIAGVRQAEGLISLITDRIDHEVIAAAEKLRVIANVAVGYNNIDVGAAQERGIVVTNTPDVLTDATADLTWALILALARRIVEADAFVRAGKFTIWELDLFLGMGLSGKTLGVIGYGRIGRAVARRATGFGMQVLYCGRDEVAFRDDPPRTTGWLSRKSNEAITAPLSASARQDGLTAKRAGFQELLAQADIITLHVPLAAATRHLIDQAALAKMKPTAYLINTARGEVVDEAALIAALNAGQLAGAGLDVYEHEPQVSPQLMTMNQVVLLPHIGSATRETRTAMALLAVENTIDALSGRTPRNTI